MLMNCVMDLNLMPLPEEDEEENVAFTDHKETPENVAPKDHKETAVEIFRREREERKARMKRKQIDDRAMQITQSLDCDEGPLLKKNKFDNKNKLPPGWLDCPKYGQEIGLIIPSKVPLDDSFNHHISDEKRYSFQKVLHYLQRVKGIEIGMVVDLTNTDRYYQTSEFENRSLKFLKIRCQGRDAVPDNESVNTFVFEVARFIHSQSATKKYVFVHCTHGHNRTGYMIVHYLMRTQKVSSVTEAIERFATARPPGIYKQEYIDALYGFYHEPKTDLVVCPPTPEWKMSSDPDEHGAVLPENDDDGVSYASINEKSKNIVTMTNDDVLGDKIPEEQQDEMRSFCYRVLKPPGGFTQFPGSHPVSLDREKLQLLRQRYYYATWKADGTRYMLLLCPHGCYLVDRSYNFRRIQMRFPGNNNTQFHHYTLLDGEMIIDAVSPHKQERRYLIYDMMAINWVSLVERPFYERWKMIEKEIIEPRNSHRRLMDKQTEPPYRYDLEPFRVRRKDFWLLSTVGKLLKEFIPNLSHDADGLIFQGWDDPYIAKTHEGLLKWKYPDMNSIDFLFELGEDDAEHLYLYDKGVKRLMEGNTVTFGAYPDPSLYSGKIIECSWDSEENVWVYMRIRTDKLIPNEFSTYKKVMESIRDNITEDILLNEIGEIIRLPMYTARIQSDSRAMKKVKPPPQRNL